MQVMTTATPTALLVLGAQRALLDSPGPLMGAESLVQHLRPLVERARRSGSYVVFLQHDGAPGQPDEPFSKGWTLHNDFRVEHGDLLLRHAHPDPFEGSSLDGELRTRAVRRVILAGAPSRDLLVTARTAHTLGYEVALVRDAHADPDAALVNEVNTMLVGAEVNDLYPES